MKARKNRKTRKKKLSKKKINKIKYYGSNQPIKIIASMTTIPSRIEKLNTVIDHILKQTINIDHIEINIPYKFSRTNEEYIIPDWLSNMDKVKIYRTEDYGPATKVVPTLLRYKDTPNIYIWSCDDDVYYPNNTLSLYTDGTINNETNEIKGYEAYDFDPEYQFTDINARHNSKNYYVYCLQGFASILYPPNIIKDDFIEYIKKCLESKVCVNDDIILGNYFAKHSIYLLMARPFNIDFMNPTIVQNYGNNSNALHVIHSGYKDSSVKCIDFLKNNNMYFIDKIFNSIIEKNKKI